MIRMAKGEDAEREQRTGGSSGRQEGGFRVNWLTQRGGRTGEGISQERRMIDTSNIKHLKLCLRKEISLVPALPAPSNESATSSAHLHPNQQRMVGLQEVGQYSSENSHKNSCEKRGKLSLISKRPSLRKISDFISFKQEVENAVPVSIMGRKQERGEVAPGRQEGKREGKKCIRISAKRQCLAELIKN